MFFLQMSGYPGSGKSTLARRIAKHTGAIVIDHDIVKTALLESMNTSIEAKAAGHVSYHIEWALIDFHLSQGRSVILDSPCLYEVMVDKGMSVAIKYGAAYKYVECYLNDRGEINRRLKSRFRMISQIEEASSEEGFQRTLAGSKKPPGLPCLVIDSSRPLDSYLNEALDYIRQRDRASFTIREASDDELIVVHRVMVEAFMEYDGVLQPGSGALRETVDSIRGKIAGRGGAILVRDGLEVIGSAQYYAERDYLYIGRVSVVPERRGEGIGKRIMSHLEGLAREKNIARTRIGVRLSIPDNIAYYTKMGYAVIEEHEYPDRSDGWYIMSKKLQE